MILHGIEYQRPTSLNMRILADHVTYSFLAFMKSIFHFCLGCYCGGYSQNGRSNLSSFTCSTNFCIFLISSYQKSTWLNGSFTSSPYIIILVFIDLVIIQHTEPQRNWRHFVENILKCAFLYENYLNLIDISWKFVPKGPLDKSALVQVMLWHLPVINKPLSELMLTAVYDAVWRHKSTMSRFTQWLLGRWCHYLD